MKNANIVRMSAKANDFYRLIILTILIYLTSPISRYDVLVDIAPEIKWIPDNNAYKNLKIVVEMDSDIDAHTASEQEFRRRYKSIGALKVVTDRAKGITLPSSIKQGHTIWIYACALYLVVADTMKIFTD
ncbi:hypothetical protein AAZV13_14G019100 [Glycine max]